MQRQSKLFSWKYPANNGDRTYDIKFDDPVVIETFRAQTQMLRDQVSGGFIFW